ncbi:unnamed protein product [Moneuplotes crassus]|uniref:tRNA (guanine-N(7)-)-methyltransferase n=1 Tax=Euplotes crassus TaxID=5936 RepID=A0AAD1XKM8_EUPCR|nr:unnamed protein product [Moneuplotes crassus]
MKRTHDQMEDLEKEGEDGEEEKEEAKIGKDSEIIDTMGNKREYATMPKKTKYRMRAHVNPLNEPKFPFPLSPEWVDWSLHYPAYFGKLDNNGDRIVCNTPVHPVTYDTKPEVDEKYKNSQVRILDIGCGYGNLLIELSKEFPEKLILGMEIRDKVTEFVVDKINALRINSGYTKFTNIAAIMTNVMKLVLNYFGKGQLEKIFICFADPHFKKSNYRRRIINGPLLCEYAHLLKEGGKIYTVTDVKDLYDWNVNFLGKHALFEEVTGSEKDDDPCVKMMSEQTDEAKKVIKRGDPVWSAVFRKITGKPSTEALMEYMK